jgi:hypothetical protein
LRETRIFCFSLNERKEFLQKIRGRKDSADTPKARSKVA